MDLILKNKIDEKVQELLKVLNTSYDKELGLLRGEAGIILSLLYYSILYDDKYTYNQVVERINNLLNELNKSTVPLVYSKGLAGIGCFFCHLKNKKLFSVEDDGFFKIVDKILNESLINDIQNNNFDFLHGYIGLGYYFLQRKNDEPIKLILSKLFESAIVENDQSIKWQSIYAGTEVFNLGLSHGMASILIFLCKAIDQNIEIDKAKFLLIGALKFILKSKFDSTKYVSTFPNIIYKDKREIKNSRLAWCFGDLGIAISLWISGKTLSDQSLKEEAIDIFKNNIPRKGFSMTSIKDSGFCHGAAGVAHIYNRIYWETGIDEFKINSEYWIEDLLSRAVFTDGLAGYKSFYGKYGWINELGILEGIAGVFLTLISFEKNNFDWDEILLLT